MLRRPGAVLALLLLAVATVHVLAYPGLLSGDPAMLGPQENLRLHLAQRWIDAGTPTLPLRIPAGLPADAVAALTPRDAALLGDVVVPKDFPLAVALPTLLTLVDPRLTGALSGLSGLALLLSVAALARRLDNAWSGVAAAALLAATGSYAAGTSGPLNTGAALAGAVVLGVLLLVPRTPTPPGAAHATPGRDLLAGLCFGAGITLHADVVLLVAGVVLPFVLPLRTGWARACRIATGALLVVLSGLAWNTWLYGSPVTTGYAVAARRLGVPGEPFFSLFDLDPGMLASHLRLYVLRPEVGLLLLGCLLAIRQLRRPPARAVAQGILLGGVPYLVFAGARPLYGVDEFTVGASWLRYALPVVALLLVVAAAAPWGGPSWIRSARALALGGVLLLGIVVATSAPGGLVDQHRQVVASTGLRAQVLAATDTDSVIVTARADKLLWPERVTVTAAYLVRDRSEGLRDGRTMYDVVPAPRRLAEVVAALAGAGQTVYLMSDALPPDAADLDRELLQEGLRRAPTAVRSLSVVTTA